MSRRAPRLAAAAFLLAALLAWAAPAQAAPPAIEPVGALAQGKAYGATPVLEVAFSDPDGDIDLGSVSLFVGADNILEELPELVKVSEDGLAYSVSEILPLAAKNYTLRVGVGDLAGERTERAYNFTVDLSPPPAPPREFPLALVVGILGLTLGVGAVGAVAVLWHLQRKGRFNLRKFLLRDPERFRGLVLWVPLGAAVVGALLAMLHFSSLEDPPRFATEYTLVAAGFAGIGPWGLQARARKRRTRAYERAFAQFLFELSDALRGGIDPMKAIGELAKTEDGVLKKPLRRAADAIRLGRPMEEVMRQMTRPMGSAVVSRYGSLVGEASAMGGSVGNVIQRAARDMDEIVKVQDDRRRQLRTPVMTMYMAFLVLFVMILQLVDFAPTLGALDFSALGIGGGGPEVPRMPTEAMESGFFRLVLVNSLGAGLLVGSFVEGKARAGILHAMVMVGIAALVYPLTL